MPNISTTIAAVGSATLLAIASFSTGQAMASDPKPPAPDSRPAEAPAAHRAVPDAAHPAELLYVPITRCRAVDTRKVGILKKNANRAYYIAGDVAFAAQGGKTTGCGIPTSATAVVATVFAAKPKAAGSLKAWAAGLAEPAGNSLYYTKSSVGTAQQLTIPLRTGAGRDMLVKNYTAKTNLVIDVDGYYVPPMYAYIGSSGSIIDQSGRLVSATKTGVGTYTLAWDRDISNCAGQGSSDISGYIVSVYTSGTNSYVYVYNNAGVATDYWVNVNITC